VLDRQWNFGPGQILFETKTSALTVCSEESRVSVRSGDLVDRRVVIEFRETDVRDVPEAIPLCANLHSTGAGQRQQTGLGQGRRMRFLTWVLNSTMSSCTGRPPRRKMVCFNGERPEPGTRRTSIGGSRESRTPVRISLLAAESVFSSVSRLRAPSWSSSPYSPHAENGGSPSRRGRLSNGGLGLGMIVGRLEGLS